MEIDLKANQEKFENLLRTEIKREGVEQLIEYLKGSDFYTAPATTQYGLSVEGGLCQHALDIYSIMLQLADLYAPKNKEGIRNGATIDDDYAFTDENIAVVALLSQLTKMQCFVKDKKNVKVNGKWEEQEYWRWDEQFKYTGRGAKSVFIIQQFMKIWAEEAQAIGFMMMGRDNPLSSNYDGTYMEVYDKSKLSLLLGTAVQLATYLPCQANRNEFQA